MLSKDNNLSVVSKKTRTGTKVAKKRHNSGISPAFGSVVVAASLELGGERARPARVPPHPRAGEGRGHA